jgi:hypothetical protein
VQHGAGTISISPRQQPSRSPTRDIAEHGQPKQLGKVKRIFDPEREFRRKKKKAAANALTAVATVPATLPNNIATAAIGNMYPNAKCSTICG